MFSFDFWIILSVRVCRFARIRGSTVKYSKMFETCQTEMMKLKTHNAERMHTANNNKLSHCDIWYIAFVLFLSKYTSNDLQITAFYIFLVVITEAVNQI